jgi:flagellar protein FlaF
MRSAAQTYKSVARQTSNPRELEASLLLQAASRLQSVHDGWDHDAPMQANLNDALLYNRKLWSVFLAEMTDANNPMPRDLRQNVANIGIFVTVSVMQDPKPEQLGPLININREIAAGLLGRG